MEKYAKSTMVFKFLTKLSLLHVIVILSSILSNLFSGINNNPIFEQLIKIIYVQKLIMTSWSICFIIQSNLVYCLMTWIVQPLNIINYKETGKKVITNNQKLTIYSSCSCQLHATPQRKMNNTEKIVFLFE